MKILGLIPARGGSKGVPGKNIKPLGGVPLLGRAILSAREAGVCDRLWVSTDDAAIAAVAEEYGVKVPWLRPPELAQDGSALVDATLHLLDKLAQDEGYKPDAVLVLQPTSPFRSAQTILKAVELFRSTGESVVSVTPSRFHPHWCYLVEKDGRLTSFIDGLGTPAPRQQLPEAYALDGSVFMVSVDTLRKTKTFHAQPRRAIVVSSEEAADVDTPYDWAVVSGLQAERARAQTPPSRVFVIAEAGVNHNGDLASAKKLADAAKACGADAVKYQSFKAEGLVSRRAAKAEYQKKTTGGEQSQLDMIKGLQLSDAAHRELAAYCRSIGITFLSTPFDADSADLLDGLGVPLLKVPSGEITNKPLIRHVASKGKPLIVSTGMSTLSEVADAVRWAREVSSAPLTLLHCLTEYPAPVEQVNLLAMDTLREHFGLPVGYSDHTPGIEVSVAAAARGAAVIEKHLTLDKALPGPDQAASLDPAEFAALVKAVRAVTAALGDGIKRAAPCEAANRTVARRSVVAARDLPAGHTLAAADLALKRPGDGIAPAELERLPGRRLKKAVAADETLTWEALA
ncbi:MAG: N-acetylneuraminate synthase [Elusimicrobiota bacterium]|nr:N-acetylneuraminate synthase [Elusimicrobiota bacterium]